MKHLKRFNESGVGTGLVVLGAAAMIKSLYNIVKKRIIFKGLSKNDFDKLEYLTNQYVNNKELIGDVIDNDDYAQVIYKYGGSDNMITIQVYKSDMKLKFKWNFEMPIFPYLKYSSDDSISVDLSQENLEKLQEIINKIKGEKSTDSGIGKNWTNDNIRGKNLTQNSLRSN